MPDWIKSYVRWVEAINYRVGRFTMYLLFVIMGVMLWSIGLQGHASSGELDA